MTTLGEEIKSRLSGYGCPDTYLDHEAKFLLSLILKHIEEKLTVIGDEEVARIILDTRGLVFNCRPGLPLKFGKSIAEKQLQHIISQLKEILTNKEELENERDYS